VVNTIRVTGPAEDRERLKAAIEASAIDRGEGVECLRQYFLDREKWLVAFPEWGDFTALGTLESKYGFEHLNPDELHPLHHQKDDMRPVRTVGDALIVQTVTEWDPPIGFAKRLGVLLPRLEVSSSSLELTNGIFTRWRSRAGESELLERRCSVFLREETYEWEKQGKVWMWVDEREADIEMMWDFLRLECAGNLEELRTACRLAYDALAFPGTTLRSDANNYAYSLACTIAEYRHALILAGVKPVHRTPDQPGSGGPQKTGMAEDGGQAEDDETEGRMP
jgi:hypothetical protein